MKAHTMQFISEPHFVVPVIELSAASPASRPPRCRVVLVLAPAAVDLAFCAGRDLRFTLLPASCGLRSANRAEGSTTSEQQPLLPQPRRGATAAVRRQHHRRSGVAGDG